MPMKTLSGRTFTDGDLDRLAESAEAGLDVSTWRPRPGRPALSATTTAHAPRIAVRLPEVLRERVALRAAAEGRSISEVVRGLLEDYASSPNPDSPAHPELDPTEEVRAGLPVRWT